MKIDTDSIRSAEQLIRPYIRRTPVIEVRGEDFGLDLHSLILKLELLQHSGSFKPRGAFTNMLMRTIPDAGIVAASGGNHGAAVAYAARKLGKPAKIFVPSVASRSKQERIRSYGADLVIAGERYSESLAESEKWREQSGAIGIHAYDQAETIIGQGTLGLELESQFPEMQTLLVAVGGGGLIGGIATWYSGRIKIVAVEPENAPTLAEAFKAGKPVDAPAGGIAADSLAPKRIGELMFPIAQKYITDSILVTDSEILNAQKTLWEKVRIPAEPGGAAALAALLSHRYIPRSDERVAVLICGGNTDAVRFEE